MLPQGIRLGDRYLTAFNVSTNEDWVWGAVAYLAVAYILLSMLSALIVEKVCNCVLQLCLVCLCVCGCFRARVYHGSFPHAVSDAVL